MMVKLLKFWIPVQSYLIWNPPIENYEIKKLASKARAFKVF